MVAAAFSMHTNQMDFEPEVRDDLERTSFCLPATVMLRGRFRSPPPLLPLRTFGQRS